MRPLRLISFTLVMSLALAGCLDQTSESEYTPTDPAAVLQARSAANGFMPMSLGNHWTYDWAFTTQVVPEGGAPEPPVTERGTIDIVHVEYRSFGDREYILERETYSGESGARERLRRQDRAGYYIFERPKDKGKTTGRPVLSSPMQRTAERIARRSGADLASVEAHLARVDAVRRMLRGLDPTPDASPPGGAFQDEIQPLAYPLHMGATWAIRGSPLFAATVEAREQFRGFSAWRIRIDSGFSDADDHVHVWYSRCGEVGRRVHFESPATAPDGTPLGTFVSDEYVDIIALDVDRGGCDIATGGDGGGGIGHGINSYPIAIGSRWTYEMTSKLKSGDDPPTTTITIVDDVQEEWVQLKGQDYVRQVARPRDSTIRPTAQLVRQDRDGLYQGQTAMPASVNSAITSLLHRLVPRVSSGPEGDELTVLAYPVKVGASWTIVSIGSDPITATVEARERLSLPAGEFDTFRVRIRNPFQSESDEAFVWYGREGVVKSYVRASIGGGDWVEEVWVLQELELAR